MKTTAAKDRIIVALDVEDMYEALRLVELLHADVGAFKIRLRELYSLRLASAQKR